MSEELAFGRYQLVMEMARGGMATLYLARLQELAQFEKLLVIKKVHDHLAKEEAFINMFMDEARITALINHTNVASVFDMGEEKGANYLAMEYVHGHNLLEILRSSTRLKGVLTWPLAARIIAEAAAGLHAAHELKSTDGTRLHVVHRDVSPSNILVSYGGQVKVVDFGIALAAQRMTTTTTGTLKGKAAYMSPEQVSNGLVTHQSDIFSLGIVLFESVTGRRLFKGNSAASSVKRVCEAQVPRPRILNPDLPVELEQIILKALASDPADRFATASAFEQALEQVLSSVGMPMGRAQLAGLMDHLFHDLRKVKDKHIRAALEGVTPGAPKKGVAMGSCQTSSSTTVMHLNSAVKSRYRRRHLVPWLARGAGILVVTVMLGFVVLGRGQSSGVRKTRGVAGASMGQPSIMTKPADRFARDATVPVPLVPSKPGAMVAQVTVKVTVLPRKASVVTTFQHVHYRGNTFRMVVPRKRSPEKITIRAPGYRSVSVLFTPTADFERTVTLRRLYRRHRPPMPSATADWVMGIR